MIPKGSLTKRELLQKIQEIDNLDLNNISIEGIKELIDALLTGHTMFSVTYKPGLVLYRGVKYATIPENVSYLTYPPKHKAKINRASRDGEQMFYASAMREIPFFELGCEIGEKLVISKWISTKTLLVNNVGFTDENFKYLNSNRETAALAIRLQEMEQNYREEDYLIKNFLARAFSQKITSDKAPLYKLTIAIGEKLYRPKVIWEDTGIERDEIDALVYPTIAMHASSDNLAIKPSFIDTGGLKLLNVEYLEINDHGPEVINSLNYDYRAATIAEADEFLADGQIVWKDRIEHWSHRRKFEELTIDWEDGQWVARDDEGNIVEPEH